MPNRHSKLPVFSIHVNVNDEIGPIWRQEMNNFVKLLVIAVLFSCNLANSQDLAFQLPDVEGNLVRLEKQENRHLTVICFLGTECPLARLYAARLNEMNEAFPDVDLVGMCSNQQDSLEDLIAYRDKYKINFALIKDRNNIVADQFQAQRTPEVFLLDQDLDICYRGRIDDQYQPGVAKSKTTRDDLKIAITEFLAGSNITMDSTEPYGCLIGRIKKASDPNSEITFSNQISRILQNHCSECHQDGQIGPMSLTDYDEIVGWADMIQEVVDENRMPPWHADPKHGQFVNERRMSKAEKQMLRDWVEAGTPLGDKTQLPPEPPIVATSKWRLPKEPDAVFEMRAKPFTVPAEGTVDYQYFVVDPGFKEDKWVTAAEILPGDRSILHHSIVFVRPPDGETFRGIGWLAAYVPGQSAPTYNPKFGRRIPAGSKLVFQQHYTPTGNQKNDITRIGMVFGDENKIENEVFTLVAVDQEFVIPPGASNHLVRAEFPWIPKRGNLLGFSPHMHYRGKSFELTAEKIEGTETLLHVPHYDFNWQHIYQLQTPIPLDQIKSIRFTAGFDNSSKNPFNPDPKQTVTWGDQTWEEMAVAFAIVSQPRTPGDSVNAPLTPEEQQAAKAKHEAIVKRAENFTQEFFERFDSNSDDLIDDFELPRATRDFGRWRLDFDGDGIIKRDDILKSAINRFTQE